jgi:DeoR family transcriptional regulator, ulaG and ulaABCDEF operon transcriptional repressor
MHATERELAIIELLRGQGFVAFRVLESLLKASPATLRRDLEKLAADGRIERVHGGARLIESAPTMAPGLSGVPFHENIARHRAQKEAIGRAAAGLCSEGEAIMIDGGSTTLQMCPHLDGLNLQVLTNSLHIVSALLPQSTTRVQVPGGTVFREQNIILSAVGDDLMPRFIAPKLFMGAASVGPMGVMQADIVLVAAERRFIERAQQVIVLVDSSKFQGPSGSVVCGLDDVDVIVTDAGIKEEQRKMLEAADVTVLVGH